MDCYFNGSIPFSLSAALSLSSGLISTCVLPCVLCPFWRFLKLATFQATNAHGVFHNFNIVSLPHPDPIVGRFLDLSITAIKTMPFEFIDRCVRKKMRNHVMKEKNVGKTRASKKEASRIAVKTTMPIFTPSVGVDVQNSSAFPSRQVGNELSPFAFL